MEFGLARNKNPQGKARSGPIPRAHDYIFPGKFFRKNPHTLHYRPHRPTIQPRGEAGVWKVMVLGGLSGRRVCGASFPDCRGGDGESVFEKSLVGLVEVCAVVFEPEFTDHGEDVDYLP